MKGMWLNPYNWKCAIKAVVRFRNPLGLPLHYVLAREGRRIGLKTPTGPLTVTIRNRESVKTIYSIFVRNDYKTPNDTGVFIDCGGNIGVSSIYFLTRNINNRVYVFEPDPENQPYLRTNLKPFAGRAFIFDDAITSDGRRLQLNLSVDGKYSSAIASIPSHRSIGYVDVPSLSIQKVIEFVERKEGTTPITIKIDVEGMEEEIIKGIDFTRTKHLMRIIVESRELGAMIPNVKTSVIRSGYVGDYLLAEDETVNSRPRFRSVEP